jgi:hypothetical protein
LNPANNLVDRDPQISYKQLSRAGFVLCGSRLRHDGSRLPPPPKLVKRLIPTGVGLFVANFS